MLYSQGHGRGAFLSNTEALSGSAFNRSFRYYSINLGEITHDSESERLLVELGSAMTDPTNFPDSRNAAIAPIITYFGQFIDHDISAGTDRDPQIHERLTRSAPVLTSDPLRPVPRPDVESGVVNVNTGMLDLDSLYGDVQLHTDFDRKLAAALRHPTIPGKMLIARPELMREPDGTPREVMPPRDRAADLLRLGRHLGETFTETELLALPDPKLRNLFFFVDDAGNPTRPNLHRALIGDARNDENLFVAQMHLAMLRLHNRIVDACDDVDVIKSGSDALFAWAKTRTRWIYQWLVVNTFLPEICDPETLVLVRQDQAALYSWFLRETGGAERLPLPLEFSAATYRFGHSMVREAYDWNAFFTPAGQDLLFAFTGGVRDPMFGRTKANLPSDWVADWSRLAFFDDKHALRATRAIDTNLSITLAELPEKANEPVAPQGPNLAQLNLFKGHLLNLPSAQALIDELSAVTGRQIPALTTGQIASGGTAAAVDGTRLATETPLWFYILKEAEIMQDGQKLGPLGSLIVASTLLGLVVHDPNSFWHQTGSDGGRWHPRDGVKPSGITVVDLPALLRAALVL